MKRRFTPGVTMHSLIFAVVLINLCLLLLCGCSREQVPELDNGEEVVIEETVDPEIDEVKEITGISIEETLTKIWEEVDASEWEIAFISNTGVTQSFTAKGINSPMEALLSPDGKAGQWVVELYKDEPEPFSEGEREGIGYPFQPILVTSQQTSLMPETILGVPAQLMPLKQEYIEALPRALELSIDNVNINYDRISVLSNVLATGECNWVFRFYDISLQQLTALVLISGDGQTIHDVFVGDELDELIY